MDIEQIKALVEMMVEHDLSRLEWQDGDHRLLLRRGQPVPPPSIVTYAAAPPLAMSAVAPATAGQAGDGSAPPPAGAASVASAGSTSETLIRSPMVGTFYASPDPKSPPFIVAGDSVLPERVVCLIEAMKVFNEIKAEASGRISRVLAKSGQAVEYDQPLFVVVPA